jgi:1-phosphofructokinase
MTPCIATVTLNPAIDETIRIENFRAGSVNRVRSRERHAGGKGINVATFVSDYGITSTATGFLGIENDALFKKHFAEKKIGDNCIRLQGETRTGIKIIDTVSGYTTDINYPGLVPDSKEIDQLKETVSQLAVAHELFVVSGSIPAGTDPVIYKDLVALIKSHGRQVIVDTSGGAFRSAVSAGPDIIKPNIHELEEFSGKEFSTIRDLATYCREFLRKGISLVVVSMGSEGALFITESEMLFAVPPKSAVLSTVGAGDAMVAGIACGRVKRLSLSQTASLATAFSLVAITHIAMGIDSPGELAALSESVTVHILSEKKEELWLKSLR